MNIHPLSRQHLKQKQSLSGMPGQEIDPQVRQLHLNVNYFLDTPYIAYPSDSNHVLAEKYFDFLRYESQWKKNSNSDLSFLQPSNALFISSSNAIDLIVRTFCEPKMDSICIASPTFPLYAFCASNHLVDVIDVPLEGYNLDVLNVPKILESGSKVLFIPAPSNPVGSFPKRKFIEQLLEEYKGIIVLDEAYIEFSDQQSFAPLIDKYPDIFILRSFSKCWGHAGIRCGVTLGNQALIASLKNMLPPCFFPSHTQEIVHDLLSQASESMFPIFLKNKAERAILMNCLEEMLSVDQIYPSEANFIFVKFSNANIFFEELLRAGFLVKNCDLLVRNALRISLGNEMDNQKLLLILKEIDQKVANDLYKKVT